MAAGDLIDVDIVSALDLVSGNNFTGRFPTPPLTAGFLIDPDEEFAWDFADSLPTGTLYGVLFPEGNYLEPTLGQIWPRIG